MARTWAQAEQAYAAELTRFVAAWWPEDEAAPEGWPPSDLADEALGRLATLRAAADALRRALEDARPR